MKSIQGKKALVTGAASGIGRAIALELAAEGADVFLLDINSEGLDEVVRECKSRGVQAIGHHCDLSDRGQIDRSIDGVLKAWGYVDILVNNAGVAFYGPTVNMTAEQWDWLLGVNLHAPIQITRLLLPSLLSRPEAQILNVCSIAGLVAGKRLAAYHTSKFALVGFTESLRVEYRRRPIGVTALCPGFVKTNMFTSIVNGNPNRKPVPQPPNLLCTTSDHVAKQAIRAILKKRGFIVMTTFAHITWFMRRHFPRLFDFIRLEKWRKVKKSHKSDAAQPVAAPAAAAIPDVAAPLDHRPGLL